MESLVDFFKSALEKRSWLLAIAALGWCTFALRKGGYIDDLSVNYYYPVVGAGLLASLLIVFGCIADLWPRVKRKWDAKSAEKKRSAYAVKNLDTAGKFERAVLLYYKGQGQQRFRARRDAAAFGEMVRHGFITNDSFDRTAYMQHYKILDVVWDFLDAPPEGWSRGAVLNDINWE